MDAKYLPAGISNRGAPSNIPAKRLEMASVPSMVASLPKDWGYRGPAPKSMQARFDPVPTARAFRYPGPTPKQSSPAQWAKSDCGCKGAPCGDDEIHTLDERPGVPDARCEHYVDRRESAQGSGIYRPMSVTFTASEYTALVLVWLDYENAHPRPGIGIDPSSGRSRRPWSPPAPFGLDERQRAQFLAEHRWPQVDAYVVERSGANGLYPRAIAAAMARQYPWLESLHARMGLALGSGSWSLELANWLLTTTSEWVCWRGVYIPTDPDTARNRFRMLGFYPPPVGVYAGEPVVVPVELTERMSPCPPGMHLEQVPISPREWDQLQAAAEEANRTTGDEIGRPGTHLNPDLWNSVYLDHFLDEVRSRCPSCWESISVSELVFLLRRDSLPIVPCAALGLPPDCAGRPILFYGNNVGWSSKGTLERLPPFRCVARGFGG